MMSHNYMDHHLAILCCEGEPYCCFLFWYLSLLGALECLDNGKEHC